MRITYLIDHLHAALRLAATETLALALVCPLLVVGPAPGEAKSPRLDYFQVVFDVTGARAAGFKPGFGYSVFIDFDGRKVLFDTGAHAATLMHNLAKAGVDPRQLDAVVISHNHFDHAGGLQAIRAANPEVPVYAPPGQELDGGPVIRLDDQHWLGPNLIVMRTTTDTPTVGISDELSMLIKTAKGPYLMTACSHTGVATIVDKAIRVTGQDIHYYTGGARLTFRDEADSRAVTEALKLRRVGHISPGHCSVDHNVERVVKEAAPDSFVASKLGERVPLPVPGS